MAASIQGKPIIQGSITLFGYCPPCPCQLSTLQSELFSFLPFPIGEAAVWARSFSVLLNPTHFSLFLGYVVHNTSTPHTCTLFIYLFFDRRHPSLFLCSLSALSCLLLLRSSLSHGHGVLEGESLSSFTLIGSPAGHWNSFLVVP